MVMLASAGLMLQNLFHQNPILEAAKSNRTIDSVQFDPCDFESCKLRAPLYIQPRLSSKNGMVLIIVVYLPIAMHGRALCLAFWTRLAAQGT